MIPKWSVLESSTSKVTSKQSNLERKSTIYDHNLSSLTFDFRVIVVLENKIYVYNFENLKMIEVLETSPNPKGIVAVSPSKEICVLAAPDKTVGLVKVIHFDKGPKQ